MAKKSEIQDKLEKLKSILEFNAKISKTHKRPKSELKKSQTQKIFWIVFVEKQNFLPKPIKPQRLEIL